MSVSEKEVRKEMREHPWAGRELAERIALDHKMRKTTTKKGKTDYMRDYMRDRREEQKSQRLPNLSQTLGMNLIKKGKR